MTAGLRSIVLGLAFHGHPSQPSIPAPSSEPRFHRVEGEPGVQAGGTGGTGEGGYGLAPGPAWILGNQKEL